MIQYIEKGYGLHQMLAAQGIELRNVDGVWVSNIPHEQLNQLISDYNPWPFEKAKKISELCEAFEERVEALLADVPKSERDSFSVQLSEAQAYPSTFPKGLSILATARGLSLEALVNKVLIKADLYNTQYFTLQAKKDALEDVVKAFSDNESLDKLPELLSLTFGD